MYYYGKRSTLLLYTVIVILPWKVNVKFECLVRRRREHILEFITLHKELFFGIISSAYYFRAGQQTFKPTLEHIIIVERLTKTERRNRREYENND